MGRVAGTPIAETRLYGEVNRRMLPLVPVLLVAIVLPREQPLVAWAIGAAVVCFVAAQVVVQYVIHRRPDLRAHPMTIVAGGIFLSSAVGFAVYASQDLRAPIALAFVSVTTFSVLNARTGIWLVFAWLSTTVGYATAAWAIGPRTSFVLTQTWIFGGCTLVVLLAQDRLVRVVRSSRHRSELVASLARTAAEADSIDGVDTTSGSAVAELTGAREVRIVPIDRRLAGPRRIGGTLQLALGYDGRSELVLELDGPIQEEEAATVADLLRTVVRRDAGRAALHRLSLTDPLTGVSNRRGMQQHLDGLDPSVELGVVITDLDRFKRFNDTHGHAAGDALLVDFATALQEAASPGDLVTRLGGDEFCVFVRGGHAAMTGFLDRLARYWDAADHDGVNFSAGVAACPGAPLFEHALQHADAILYQAKLSSRSRLAAQD